MMAGAVSPVAAAALRDGVIVAMRDPERVRGFERWRSTRAARSGGRSCSPGAGRSSNCSSGSAGACGR